jgi:hypothetical protein
MFDALIMTVALSVSKDPVTPPPAPHRVVAPSRGMVGRFLDSNVAQVWDGVPAKHRMIWLCIRRHESMSYTGENPSSSASGGGQWINSTWDGLKKWVKIDGKFVARQYDEAKDAPAWVQDAAFLHVLHHGGLRMWHGTWCPGT